MDRGRLAVSRIVIAVATVTLAVTAARADSRLLGESAWATALDVVVGLAFVAAAAFAPAVVVNRLLMAAVGATWLLASSSLELHWLHKGLLVLALVSFPSGRPRGVIDWLLAGLGVAVLLGLVSEVGVAWAFTAVAATSLLGQVIKPAQWYRAGAGAAVALALFAIAHPGTFDPRDKWSAYEFVLILVALAFYLVSWHLKVERERFADQLIGGAPAGLDGLGSILRDVLGDTQVQIYRWRPAGGAYTDGNGRVLADRSADRDVLFVDDGSDHVAAVTHRPGTLDDPAIARAVAAAVRLTVENVRLREELDARLVELEAARARLLTAADRQRSATAARLREEVVTPLQLATDVLGERRASGGADVATDVTEAIDVAVREIVTARDELLTLVSGVPPVVLGDGRLPQAIELLAERCPVPVTVTAAPGVVADADVETTLFYVCSEALTNAAKHSEARHIEVGIETTDDGIMVAVRDDGRGGVDVSGSGILGLADRVAARGGRLRVDSPPGAGTTIMATVPR
jgi:signal transduction histidine kinase